MNTTTKLFALLVLSLFTENLMAAAGGHDDGYHVSLPGAVESEDEAENEPPAREINVGEEEDDDVDDKETEFEELAEEIPEIPDAESDDRGHSGGDSNVKKPTSREPAGAMGRDKNDPDVDYDADDEDN